MKRISAFWTRFDLKEKLLALYIITLCNYDFPVFSLKGKDVLYCDMFFLFLSTVFICGLAKARSVFKATSLEMPLIVMILLLMPSFFNSVSFFASALELTTIVYLITLFIIVYNIIRSQEKLIFFLYLWMIVASIVSLIGLLAFIFAILNNKVYHLFLYSDTITKMAHHFPRVDSIFANANMFFTHLHVSLILAIALFLHEKRSRRKWFILGCLSVILITAFFTGSRRFSGLVLSIFIILCWSGRDKIVSFLKYLSLIIFLIFLIATIITSIWVVFPIKIIKDETTRTISLKVNYSYSIHYLSPAVAINMFKKHPFIGIGFGTFNKNFKDNVDWNWLKSSFGFEAYPEHSEGVEKKVINFDPHSVIFGTLAETGLLGFFGLIYFFFNYLRLLIKRFRVSQDFSIEKIVAGCVLAGTVGFLLNGVTMDILSMRHFWLMLAIGLSGEIITNKHEIA